jgi:hypothetical protein
MHCRTALYLAILLVSILACTLGQTAPPPSEPGLAPAPPQGGQSPNNLPPSEDVILPEDLEYLGAFRLPAGGDRPFTFAYGGNAMTFNPDGDPGGLDDGYPGSLFITGHDRLPYGELPDGSRVAEVNIPVPAASRELDTLNRAEFLQDLQDVTAGHFAGVEEIVRTGLLYLDNPATGPLIHIAWGQHIEPDPTVPTHGWFSADLSQPDFQGEWFITGQSWYSVNDYMFEIPSEWAQAYVGGRVLATGRFKDGGWSGMGPVVIAYRPWDENGNPPAPGVHLEATALLRYAASTETDAIERSLSGYQHPDEWSGGAWLTTGTGRSAVLFAGAKSNGTKYWYGYLNPDGSQLPCVDEDVTDFLTCRMADGSSCPPQDFIECSSHNDYRGWWTTRWDAVFLLYDPADLARVASGEMASWEPQPYASLDIDERLYFNPSGVEIDLIGTGDQRRYRIGDVAYDRHNGLIYVLELFADEAAPVVHVWRIST